MTDKLPKGWVEVPLKDVVSKLVDGSHNPPKKQESGKLMLSARNIENNQIVFKNYRYISVKDFKSENNRTRIQPDDVLLTIVGTIGRSAVVPSGIDEFTLQRSVAVLTPHGILPKYLMYQFHSPFIQQYFEKNARGTAQKGVYLKTLGQVIIRVAPLEQQKCIVAEIEKQFSRLDEAVAGLKRAKANLKRYKAAVLKAAVEGKLTEQWRKAHPDVEPAFKLLERILAERRANWGKKYKEPKGPEVDGLPEIPVNWTWATLPQLGELNRGKSKHRPRNAPKLYGGPYPFIQTGDVRHATRVFLEYAQTYSEEGLKQSRLWPKETLCITIAANIADTAILGVDACFPDSIVGFIPETEHTDVRFVEYSLRTAKEDLERFAPATAQKNINLEILKDVAIPLPPGKEQKIIVAEVERRLSVVEALDAEVTANLQRAERLRQAILKEAFSGGLLAVKGSTWKREIL